MFQYPSCGKRVIVSNGIPSHSVIFQNPREPCEVRWVIEVPLNPSVANEHIKILIRGMIAMAMNGVPAYRPQENDYNSIVEETMSMGVQGA